MSCPPPPPPPQWLKRKRGTPSPSPGARWPKQHLFSSEDQARVGSVSACFSPPPFVFGRGPPPPPPPPRVAVVVGVEGGDSGADSTVVQSPTLATASSWREELPSSEAELPKKIIRNSASDVADSYTISLLEELDYSEFNRIYNPKKANTRQLSPGDGPVPSNFPTTFDPDVFLLYGHLKDGTQSEHCQTRMKEFQAALERTRIQEFKVSLVAMAT